MSREESQIPELIRHLGGLRTGVARAISEQTGVAEAQIYGVGSFFHLLNAPDVKLRVCQGLSCRLAGSENVLESIGGNGVLASPCSCLALCDQPPAVLNDRTLSTWNDGEVVALDEAALGGAVSESRSDMAIDLAGEPDFSNRALNRALELGPQAVLDVLEASGLQGRGGAGFPAHLKWRAVRDQAETERFVVLNADEGEPGTFKDRAVLARRPDRVVEGLTIAARVIGANDVTIYYRGAFESLMDKDFEYRGVRFHLHSGHGAYICGEETALLEALEGGRGMPRLKPPFPTTKGLWSKPTLVHNVETIACLPEIIMRGGEWFRGLGRSEPGSKLYSTSGHVQKPGTYELPLGVTLDELVEEAGGYVGTLKAFSPGGASSGFLPASERTRPLDAKSLAEVGSMLGSAGVVVLNETVKMPWAALHQLRFFAEESCGQCAPCRIGTRLLAEQLTQHLSSGAPLDAVDDVAWEMGEGSICGLGQTAALPLTSAMKYFPEEFSR